MTQGVPVPIVEMEYNGETVRGKQCTGCHRLKPLTEYYVSEKKTGRRESKCKHCTSKKFKRYNDENKEHRKEYNKQYYQANKERVDAKNREYKRGNESYKEYARDYYYRHRDEINAKKSKRRRELQEQGLLKPLTFAQRVRKAEVQKAYRERKKLTFEQRVRNSETHRRYRERKKERERIEAGIVD